MTFARITGTGSDLPEKVLTNADIEAMVDTNDEWIRERTGIRQRHIAAPDEATSDLAERAARRALEAAGRRVDDIDLIIVATTTPDRKFPSTACLLQQRLGIHGCAAFDLQAVCTGFVYALGVADKFIRCGDARCALVIGAETISRLIDWTDRSTCVLFGDGAGAVILEASEEPGVHSSHLHADGHYAHLLHVPNEFVEMKGNEVFRVATNTLGRIVDETLAANGLNKSDIDWLVPHQANIRIIEATARKLKMPLDRVIITVDRHGNTSAASIPLALDQGVRDGRIKRGDMLLLEAFGGGFTWGSALVTY
ncbi:MAG: beta-ketoacyl-ACP synthase III [Halofilum sp. (in: g-proteobacteria)]|nr:beta-ketoacyl-ACP synthase III [Halofilum sp. (in: g-proteobacteria)]